jgi:hypothetical protein
VLQRILFRTYLPSAREVSRRRVSAYVTELISCHPATAHTLRATFRHGSFFCCAVAWRGAGTRMHGIAGMASSFFFFFQSC